MAKKKRADQSPRIINQIDQVNIEIDYDKLAEALIRARVNEKKNAEIQKEKELAEWRNGLGYKTHEEKNRLKKAFLEVVNIFKMSLFLLFSPKSKKMPVSPTGACIQTLTCGLFHLVKLVLWIIATIFFAAIFFGFARELEWQYYITCLILSGTTFLASLIFRLMAIEIDQTTDRERVLGVFTGVISLVSLALTIGTLF